MKKTCKRKITYRIKELLRNKLNFISRFIFKLLDDQSFTLHCINGLDCKYTRYQIALFISSVISFCMIKNEKMYACWFEWLKMDGFLLYISYDEIDQTRESICTWRRYTKTYIVLKKEHEWFIFVKISHLSKTKPLS